ncbi:MAG: hypothetical protein COA32_01565 [Fluviicola sp.]|nr:MAG: hypothetical protein COA32_01565 [Fluviicola sp.]
MKKINFLLALAFVFTSCNKENQEPTETPTTQNNGGTTQFQYSGDNFAGKWKLDSVTVFTANTTNVNSQDTITYMPSEVGSTFTMEIYGEVYNETTGDFEKTTIVEADDMLEVDNRPHGRLYGGLSVNSDVTTLASAILSTEENGEEEDIYHFTYSGMHNIREYVLVDNNHILVTAESGFGTALWEYFTRVN